MDEQTIKEVKEEKPTAEDTRGGDKPQVLDKVERAELISKKLEEHEARLDQKISKLQELEANRLLGGGSQAGTVDEKPKELSSKEYKDYVERYGKPPA